MSLPTPIVSGGGIYYQAKTPKQFFEYNFIGLLIALGIGIIIFLVLSGHIASSIPPTSKPSTSKSSNYFIAKISE